MILAGCKHSEDNIKEDEVLSNIDIYDFYYIKKAPAANKKYDLEEVIKFYFSTNSPTSLRIAIDIKNNEIFINPRFSTNGLITSKGTVLFEDKEILLNILKKNKIQDWKADYRTEDPKSYTDGYGWYLILQFEDGTIEEHRGHGPNDDIFPEQFEEFVEEIDQLAKDSLGEDYKKDFYSEP